MRGQCCSFWEDRGSFQRDLWPSADTPELRGQAWWGDEGPQVHSKGRGSVCHPHSSSEGTSPQRGALRCPGGNETRSAETPSLCPGGPEPHAGRQLSGSAGGGILSVQPPSEHVGVERGAAHCRGGVTGTQSTQAERRL